jgi:hypothetical protein
MIWIHKSMLGLAGLFLISNRLHSTYSTPGSFRPPHSTLPWSNRRENFLVEPISPAIFKMQARKSFFTNRASLPSQIAY